MLVARFPKDHTTPKENSVVLKCRHRAKLENHRFVQPAADLWQLRSPVPTQRREKFSITLNGSRPSESVSFFNSSPFFFFFPVYYFLLYFPIPWNTITHLTELLCRHRCTAQTSPSPSFSLSFSFLPCRPCSLGKRSCYLCRNNRD